MQVFNAKKAAEEYMSSHTLTFSTPELTLMRYSFWLGEMVKDPGDNEKPIPRMMTYLEEKGDEEPIQVIDDESYIPTGAVKDIAITGNKNTKYCHICGTENSSTAKFCIECGETQE